MLFITLASMMLGIIDSGINEFAESGQSSVLRDLFGLTTLIPSLALGARRLHDIGKSGWWQLGIILLLIVGLALAITGTVLALIIGFGGDGNLVLVLAGLCALLVGMVWWVRWFVRKGDDGPNKYGPDPRQATSQQPYRPYNSA